MINACDDSSHIYPQDLNYKRYYLAFVVALIKSNEHYLHGAFFFRYD